MSTSALAVAAQDIEALPALIDRAAQALAGARSSAEVLEAREAATFAYDMAKRSARLAKAKSAHDSLVAAAHRAQADALLIESRAKMRLADEYDDAQERGDVRRHGERGKDIPDENVFSKPTVTEAGISSKEIFESRQLRDAERERPGVIGETLEQIVESGDEPNRAALNRVIVNRTNFTGNTEWFTPDEYIDLARSVLGEIDLDPATHSLAQEHIQAAQFFTESDDGLASEWHGRIWLNPPYAQPAIENFIDKLIAEVDAGHVTEAIVLTHNYTDTAWFQKAARASKSICFTKGRIRFVAPDGALAAPTQGQAFFYFGPNQDLFTIAFSDVGFIAELRS